VRERNKAVDRVRDSTRINIGCAFMEWRELKYSVSVSIKLVILWSTPL